MVRPNVDTIYSTIWLDLKAEPVVISLPDSGGRYVVMPIHDAWTNVFASIGSRTTGTGAQTVLVAGPNWQGEVPEGMPMVRSPTNMAWAIARMMSTGGDDIAAVNAYQDLMSVQTLSSLSLASPRRRRLTQALPTTVVTPSRRCWTWAPKIFSIGSLP